MEMRILDPQRPFLQKCYKILILSCVIAVSLDSLFFYIPVIDGRRNCLGMDKKLAITTCVLRSFFDMFYLLHIIFQFRTGFIDSSSGVLVEDTVAIAKRYLSSYFIIDILSLLPLPQVALLKGPNLVVMKESLMFIVFSQYVPRLIRIYPLYKEVTRTSGKVTESAWAGATSNFCLYMLACHVVGAIWYLLSTERKVRCWQDACWKQKCDSKHLYCGEHHTGDNAFLNASCPLIEPDDIKDLTVFNFGIFLDALQSGVVESRDFHLKFSYCFWWGLRSLSSLGQNLKTSTFIGEIYFAVFISAFGLVLFSLLIGNMQKYLRSATMSECMIRNLPKDLKRDLKRHLCLRLLMRVPMFEKMDEQLLDAMCDRLKPVLYTEKSFIAREGDPVDEMLFIMRGNLLTTTTNGGKSVFFNSRSVYLNAGDFCGDELLTWALLDPNSSSMLPTSTRTVEALTEVEAFALKPDDLKFVASQFRQLHSKQAQVAFRFHSQQLKTWAACFIQAAWRQYCERKLKKSLYICEEENRRQEALAKEAGTSSPRLGTTIYINVCH